MRRRELVLGAASVVIGLAACSGPVSVTPEGYRLADSTSKTVTLLVPGGPGDEIAEATATEQTAEQVVVRVRLRHNDGAWPSLLVTLEAVVTLAEPLGKRTVVGEGGQVIARKS